MSIDRATALSQQTPRPLVSIVIPSYNVAPYIEAAILSALDQTFRDHEVIVVNDGSTDETRAVIDRVIAQRQDPRLRVIDRPNGGLSAARNTGILAAQGDLIGFLDSDDIWHPTKLQKHVTDMLENPGVGISFSHSEYLKEDGQPTGSILFASKLNPSFHDLIRRNHLGNGSTAVVRRVCFEKAGLFREDLRSCEDYEMWCRILWSTEFRANAIPEPLTLYRVRETSLSFNFEKFVFNADLAIVGLRLLMKHVPDRLFRAGHAEHYRIAAWKAVSLGQDGAGAKLLLKSLRLRPWSLLLDFRTAATMVALFLPYAFRQRAITWYKSLRNGSAVEIT